MVWLYRNRISQAAANFFTEHLWTTTSAKILPHFLANFWDLDKFFLMVVFKVFTPCKTIFKVDIKSPILPQMISLWCLYYNIWTRFYLLFVLEESEVVAWQSSLKKGVLKIHCKKICVGVSFGFNLKAGGLQSH